MLKHTILAFLEKYPAATMDVPSLRNCEWMLRGLVKEYEAVLATIPEGHAHRQDFIDTFADDLKEVQRHQAEVAAALAAKL